MPLAPPYFQLGNQLNMCSAARHLGVPHSLEVAGGQRPGIAMVWLTGRLQMLPSPPHLLHFHLLLLLRSRTTLTFPFTAATPTFATFAFVAQTPIKGLVTQDQRYFLPICCRPLCGIGLKCSEKKYLCGYQLSWHKMFPLNQF